MGRKHRSFLITLKILLVLGLIASLSSCSSPSDTKLEQPDFIYFYVGNDDALPSSEVLPISSKNREAIPYLLNFSRWEKIKLSNLGSFELLFALFDDQETSYRFGKYEDLILIKIMKKDSSKSSYYSIDLDLEIVLDKTLIPMHLEEATKAELVSNIFLSGDIVPRVTNSPLSFEIDAEDNIKLKDLLKIEEWESISIPTDLPREHEMMIMLQDDKVLYFYAYYDEYLAQYHSFADGNKTIYTYRVSDAIYQSLLQTLSEIRSAQFDGPSQLVLDANFSSAYVLLENEVGKYPGWEFPLSRTESDTLKPLLNMDKWMRIDENITYDHTGSCLYSENKYSFCFVSDGEFGFMMVQSMIDPSIKEAYFIDSNFSIRGLLLSYWEDPVTPIEVKELDFKVAEVTNFGSGGDGPDYDEADRYNMNSRQKLKIETLLRFDEWTLDKEPSKYHLGMWYKYRFESADGSSILVFAFIDTTVFKLEGFDPELGVNGEFFYGPTDIFTELSKYMSVAFPKK